MLYGEEPVSDDYRKRWIEGPLAKAVKEEPVVVVTGARQVGKSTLLDHAFVGNGWRHLTLDDLDTLTQAEKDPAILVENPRPTVIDEVQRSPRILQVVKRAVDKDRSRRFILSGSANLLLMQRVSESLAGRAAFFRMEPFTWGEYSGRPPSPVLDQLLGGHRPDLSPPRPGKSPPFEKVLREGWFPPVMLGSRDFSAVRWLEGYMTSYVERDLRQLAQIDSLTDFRRLLIALSLRTGGLLNQSEIGRDISMKQPTIHRYLNILEASHLFHRLPAYAVNRTKRLMKTPKGYFLDSGLAAYLSGTAHVTNRSLDLAGPLFETAVFHHLRVWASLQLPQATLLYWRTRDNDEVDFVIEWGRHLLAVEVKATTKVGFSDARALRVFMEEYPECRAGIIVHQGDRMEEFGRGIYGIPFADLI